MGDKIVSDNSEKRKESNITRSTLWHQQKNIKEGKRVKIYSKTTIRIEWQYEKAIKG